jgi:hypothetical protein
LTLSHPTFQEGWEIANRILRATLKLHTDRLSEVMDEGDTNNTLLWTNDTTKIKMAMDILSQVDMGQ